MGFAARARLVSSRAAAELAIAPGGGSFGARFRLPALAGDRLKILSDFGCDSNHFSSLVSQALRIINCRNSNTAQFKSGSSLTSISPKIPTSILTPVGNLKESSSIQVPEDSGLGGASRLADSPTRCMSAGCLIICAWTSATPRGRGETRRTERALWNQCAQCAQLSPILSTLGSPHSCVS